ncbi:MAG: LysR family transcriptional regulator [Clostridia bacterium]|nr:LysR family transcriptional regulator [Clostridia bacterium]
MDIRQLEYFVTVARLKSFSKASSVLYMTVPGVTRKINALEEYLKFPLFERSNQGVILTRAGEAFYEDAVRILQMTRKAVENGRMLAERTQRRLCVGTVLPSRYLRSICQAYSRNSVYKLPLFYRQLTSNKGIDALLDRRIDLHLVVGDLPARAGIRYDLLIKEAPKCIMSIEHPLSARESIALSDLSGEILLLPPPGSSGYFDRLREHIARRYPAIRVETLEDAVSTYMYIEAEHAFCVTAALGGLDVPALCYKDVDPAQWNEHIDVYLARRDEPNPYLDDFVRVTKARGR